MEIPDFDPLDERYRWCIYCGADCWPDPEHQEHGDECPTVTGKWPVIPRNFPHGLVCGRCEKEITDTYRHVKITEGDGKSFATAPVMEVVCEDCWIAAFVAGEQPAPDAAPEEG